MIGQCRKYISFILLYVDNGIDVCLFKMINKTWYNLAHSLTIVQELIWILQQKNHDLVNLYDVSICSSYKKIFIIQKYPNETLMNFCSQRS